MPKTLYIFLSRREAQIMDVIYRLGEASVADVRDNMANPPAYNSIRVLLSILEKKGYLTHRQVGQKYIYAPAELPEKARRSALEHMVKTFFQGSASKTVSALLDMSESNLSRQEFIALAEMIEKTIKERKDEHDD
jgi:predicted transcriptional regulator